MRHMTALLGASALALLSMAAPADAQFTTQAHQLLVAPTPLAGTTAFWCDAPLNPANTAWKTENCQFSAIQTTLWGANNSWAGANSWSGASTFIGPASFPGGLAGTTCFDGSTVFCAFLDGSAEPNIGFAPGVYIQYNTSNQLVFNNTAGKFFFLDTSGDLRTDGTGGAFVGPLTGNASTASAWQTARTASLGGDCSGSTSVDGSANFAISATCAKTGGTAFGALATVVAGSGVATALGNAANASGGPATVNGSPTLNDCLKWTSSGVGDAGAACSATYATNSQVVAGTVTNAALSPGNFTGAGQSLGSCGFYTIPGGPIEQWCYYNNSGSGFAVSTSYTLTFPTTFPNACWNVQATADITSIGTPSNAQYSVVTDGSCGTSSIVVRVYGYASSGINAGITGIWLRVVGD